MYSALSNLHTPLAEAMNNLSKSKTRANETLNALRKCLVKLDKMTDRYDMKVSKIRLEGLASD
jgi:hypothetical protein